LDNKIADYVLTGGVVGQVFLAAKGTDLGKPNMEFLKKQKLLDLLPGIKELEQKYPERIKVPKDVAVETNGKRIEILVEKLQIDCLTFDIGAKTVEDYGNIIRNAKTIVVSGPMGVYENSEFSFGTRRHTIGALQEFKLSSRISYVSTAGGALIEFLMGKKLPGVTALEKAAARKT
jgi:phosphoglycerate kinase